jgi:hypothetical protein
MVGLTAAVLPDSIAPALRLSCKIVVGAAAYLGCISVLAPSTLRKLLDGVGQAFGRKTHFTCESAVVLSPSLEDGPLRTMEGSLPREEAVLVLCCYHLFITTACRAQ